MVEALKQAEAETIAAALAPPFDDTVHVSKGAPRSLPPGAGPCDRPLLPPLVAIVVEYCWCKGWEEVEADLLLFHRTKV